MLTKITPPYVAIDGPMLTMVVSTILNLDKQEQEKNILENDNTPHMY